MGSNQQIDGIIWFPVTNNRASLKGKNAFLSFSAHVTAACILLKVRAPFTLQKLLWVIQPVDTDFDQSDTVLPSTALPSSVPLQNHCNSWGGRMGLLASLNYVYLFTQIQSGKVLSERQTFSSP